MFLGRITEYVANYIPMITGVEELHYRGNPSNRPDTSDGGTAAVARPPQDEYIPSFPELQGQIWYTPYTPDITDAANTLPQPPQPNTASISDDENAISDSNDHFDDTFTPEEQRVIDDLQSRDREVRAHEQAHVAVGGAHIRGGVSYQYQVGPDNKQYAVGGEVSIDTSPVRDNPQATIAKMQVVRAAAMAPANPSGQDRAVAAAASQQEARAHAEMSEKRAEELAESQSF